MFLLEVDGCTNYTILSEADRAQGNTQPPLDRGDWGLVTGWYRFQGAAGDRMADKCVLLYRCGTKYPGWLNGTHPTVAEGVVTRTVCYTHAGLVSPRNRPSVSTAIFFKMAANLKSHFLTKFMA